MFSSSEHSRLSKPYRRRLQVAIPDLNDPQSVVLMLVTYIQWCFDSGVNFWVPKHVVLAVRNYLPSSLVWTKVNSSSESLLHQYISASEFAWSAPPSVPWHKLFSRERQW